MTWDGWAVLTRRGFEYEPKPCAGFISTGVTISTHSLSDVTASMTGRFITIQAFGLDLIGKPDQEPPREFYFCVHHASDDQKWFDSLAGVGRIDRSCSLLMGTTQGYSSPAPSWLLVAQTSNLIWKDVPVNGRHYFISFTFSTVMRTALREFLTENARYKPSADHVLILGLPDSLPSDGTPLKTDVPFAPVRGQITGQMMIGHLDGDRQITHVSVLTETIVPEAEAPEQAAIVKQDNARAERIRNRKKADQGIPSAFLKLIGRKS